MPTLPPASQLPLLPLSHQRTALNLLFEPTPALHTLLLPLTSLSPSTTTSSVQLPQTYPTLIDLIKTELLHLANQAKSDEAALAALENILGSHPRLGDKKVEGTSKGEQGSLSGDQAELRALNGRYEEVFPGLRYVVFVAGRPLPEILADMRRRIERRDVLKERVEAIEAMCAIAADRAGKAEIKEAEE